MSVRRPSRRLHILLPVLLRRLQQPNGVGEGGKRLVRRLIGSLFTTVFQTAQHRFLFW